MTYLLLNNSHFQLIKLNYRYASSTHFIMFPTRLFGTRDTTGVPHESVPRMGQIHGILKLPSHEYAANFGADLWDTPGVSLLPNNPYEIHSYSSPHGS